MGHVGALRHVRVGALGILLVLLLTSCAPAPPSAPTAAPKAAETKPTAAPKPAEAKPAEAKPTAAAKPADKPAAEAKPAEAKPTVAAKPAGPEPKRGGTLRIATSGDWRTLDPPVYANVTDRQVLYAIYNTLVAMDEDLNIVPELARSWEVSQDAKTWTFKLAPGVKFHDGTPFNAQAAKFNLDRILNPETASRLRQELLDIQEVQAVDDTTLRIVLKQPFTPLLAWLTDVPGMMVSPAAVEKWGKELGDHPVGTGPFEFIEQVKGDRLVLRRFKDYWEQGLPYLDEVIYRPIPDPTAKLANLRAGSLEIVDEIPSREVANLRAAPEIKLNEMQGTRWRVIHLNTASPPLDNTAVRQAVSLAIDREAIIRAVYFGNATPAYGPISPVYRAIFDPAIEQYGLKRDVEKAKQKLSEGGRAGGGFTLTLDISATPEVTRMSELIKANLAEIGVNVEIQTFDSNTAVDRVGKKNFVMSLLSWTPRPDPDGTLRRHFYSESALNYQSYKNPRVDELLDLTRRIQPGPERVNAFREMQRLLVEDAPWVYLVFENQAMATLKTVEGLPVIPDTLLRPKTVWLNK